MRWVVRVISEEKLVSYLDRVVSLSGQIVPLISEQGTQPPEGSILESYRQIVTELAEERQSDPCLQDEAWNWIFDPPEPTNLIKVYGRLAWINLQLLDLI